MNLILPKTKYTYPSRKLSGQLTLWCLTLEHHEEVSGLLALGDADLNGLPSQIVVHLHCLEGRGSLLVLRALLALR